MQAATAVVKRLSVIKDYGNKNWIKWVSRTRHIVASNDVPVLDPDAGLPARRTGCAAR